MSVKMIADRPRKNRKVEQRKRHRNKYWWNATDNDRVLHLASCTFCYTWVMRQVEASKVRHPAGSWLVSSAIKRERNWLTVGNSMVHVNYGRVGEEA